MHVEKLRPAIGFPRPPARFVPRRGLSTRFTDTSACHYPGTWRATIANNLPILEQRCDSLLTVRVLREDVANDRQSSMPTILEDCRNVPVVETGLWLLPPMCVSLSREEVNKVS